MQGAPWDGQSKVELAARAGTQAGQEAGQPQAHSCQLGHRGWVPPAPWWLQTRSRRSTALGTPVPLTRKELGYEEVFTLE